MLSGDKPICLFKQRIYEQYATRSKRLREESRDLVILSIVTRQRRAEEWGGFSGDSRLLEARPALEFSPHQGALHKITSLVSYMEMRLESMFLSACQSSSGMEPQGLPGASES